MALGFAGTSFRSISAVSSESKYVLFLGPTPHESHYSAYVSNANFYPKTHVVKIVCFMHLDKEIGIHHLKKSIEETSMVVVP